MLSLFASGKLQVTVELPALCVFKSTNLVMHSKSLVLVSYTMRTYNNAKSKTLEKNDIPKIFKAVFIKEKRSLKDKKFSNFIQIN